MCEKLPNKVPEWSRTNGINIRGAKVLKYIAG